VEVLSRKYMGIKIKAKEILIDPRSYGQCIKEEALLCNRMKALVGAWGFYSEAYELHGNEEALQLNHQCQWNFEGNREDL